MSFRNYYDSSYSRSRDTGRSTSVSSDRPTSVTAKYITPSYKSSSIPVLRNEHSSSRDKSPISSIANRYNSYSKNDKPSSKYEKKDYTKLTVPSTASKSRDVSPISTSSKYSISRTSRTSSPDRRALKSYKEKSRDTSPADRDKDIPSKTDKSTGYNSLSSYKLYPRTSSYSRPNSRSENKPDISINRTRTESKPEITVNRYAIANRLSSNYLRSPTPIKRSSLSPVNNLDSTKRDSEKSVSPTIIIEEPEKVSNGVNEESQNKSEEEVEDENETETILVVTRHTSPTPPGSSAYLRSRRAEMAKTVEKTITRLKKKPVRVDKEVQLDRLDDTARAGRFGSTVRASSTNWSYYTPSSTHYTGYAGRYSTQYSSLREPSISNYDRSSRSRSREPHPSENNISPNTNYTNYSENSDTNNVQEKAAPKQNNTEPPKDSMVTVYDEIKDCEPSEIVINVNLKLKKAKNSQESNSTELVSPEITITNSQLPPPAPKSEISTKIKKVKVRKSSTDSSDSSSKKKIVKKRSKSVSSTESDQGSDSNQSKQSSVSPPKVIQKDSSKSNLQNGISKSKHSKSRDSNSPDSIVTLSTQSSVSEEESGIKSKSNDISRTSADETSIPTDRSAKQGSPSNISKHEGEEAKSFLIRALAPVTNLFKKHQDSSENSRWPENSTSESTGKDVSNLTTESDRSLSKSKSNTNNIIASNDDNVVKLKGIRHIESGERAWWMDSDTDNKNGSNDNHVSSSDNNIPKKIRHIESGERAWWLESNSENQQSPKNSNDTPDYASRSKSKFVDDEKPWWLEDNSANIPEGIERLTPPRKTSSESDNSDKYNFFKVRHTESGDKKDWWLTSSENSSHKFESSSLSRSGSDQRGFPLKRIRHVESGERPWWLSSEKNIPEGIEKLPTPPPQQESDTSDSEEVQAYYPPSQIPPFPLHLPDDEPLGDRRSPEGLEAPGENEEYSGGRSSPYENDQHYRQRSSVQMPYQKNPGQYISRFVDIDDILGKSGQVFSPYMDSILSRRTGLTQYEDEHCEEIDPTQVRIHDSTPQRPVIKKLRCRSEIIDCTGDGLDDATLQVFKDGEYGPYLDLDSTLAEQEEDLDGLQESRKNALILRTQLPVQVHAMIEKLHNSQGKELRRHLLSLKQKFQTDKDLVHAFVANKGLDCLMDVANINDQNYIDYILRAFGQLILYVDGMHGVMRQQECVRWLYTLVGNKYRHVIKTTLELLIVYVDYAELNCLQFVDAVAYVDSATRHPPWYNVMRILQDVDASDTELLIYATTLINKCLNKIPVRDVYYDQVDALQDQGMDEIIKLYMSKQGTDLDLLRQLQIFEAVLLYEDGDESGTALQQLDDSIIKSIQKRSVNVNSSERRKSKKQQMKEKGTQRYTSGLKQRILNGTLGHTVTAVDALAAIRQKQLDGAVETKDERGIIINREHSIKDLAQRITSPISPTTEEKQLRVGDMAGIVSKAKKELAKSQSKEIVKSPTIEKVPKVLEIKVSENDLHWEELKKSCAHRPYHLCDLDFSELQGDADDDVVFPAANAGAIPPPPPPAFFSPFGAPPPFPIPATKPVIPVETKDQNDSDSSTLKKKKTVKLFWREIHENPTPIPIRSKIGGFIWDDLPEVPLDTAILEHLFETRTNDLVIKDKLMEPKCNMILDTKRSNAINIALKKLPTPQTIKAAIMKMDTTVIGREGIEMLLTMLPTEEEKVIIQEAQYANPDLPLDRAEQFLLALASINELSSRLKLWVFKLDFENTEKEIAEPLMDLMQGIELLKANKTFKVILSTLRSVGNFLNGSPVKGFRLEYLSKVMVVKDTVHKHPLLYHICEIIISKFSDTTDFFSEVGPVIRASKVDFDELQASLASLETDCKASWDHMKRVAKHDGSQVFITKLNEFLTDAAQRIILLNEIQKKVMSRYKKLLLYLGVPLSDMGQTKPTAFLKVIAEFALEYRTTRERVLLQLEKRANHRERNKTRGKMIMNVNNYATKNGDHSADSALKELLNSDPKTVSLTDPRRKYKVNPKVKANGDVSPDDEIIESLVRSATSKRQNPVRERRRNRISDNKTFNRTLDGHQSWPGRENGPAPGSATAVQYR